MDDRDRGNLAAAGRHVAGQLRGLERAPASSTTIGRFGRMFRRLPVYSHELDHLASLAATMIGEGPDEDRALADPEPDEDENPRISAGYTYLGQFIDHDITFDPVSSLTRQNDPDALTDFRTPRLDLDSLYGRGPDDQPFLYARDRLRFLLGPARDLPRNQDDRALIGDPRNDENLIVSQLHGLFLRFHNAMIDQLETGGLRGHDLFQTAQQEVRWRYQWLVVHDFLAKVAGPDVVDDILRAEPFAAGDQRWTIIRPRCLFYQFRENPFMPVEFSVAAYRFGHSMVRPSYHLNEAQREVTERRAAPLRANQQPASFRLPILGGGDDTLAGFRRLPEDRQIDWAFFFDLGGGSHLPQPSYKIDTSLSDPLADLVAARVVPDGLPSLAERNLVRGQRLSLPSGQSIAAAVGIAGLTAAELALGERQAPAGQRLSPAAIAVFSEHTPLWFYILREAETRSEGARLGPVGARVVAEVIIGLLAADPTSYLGVSPNWTPPGGDFRLPDLIDFVARHR